MKTVLRILAAFITFLVSFSHIEALEREACFTLNVNFWSTGEIFYQWYRTPLTMPVNLQCPTGEYVHLTTIVNYAIPKYMDNYCLQGNRRYNFNKNSGCTYEIPCSCCNKPLTDDELCFYERPSTQVLASGEIETCRQGNTCTVNVQRTEIPSSINPQCQDYVCRDAGTITAGGEYSRCYSRWVTVSYQCTSTPPPTTTTAHTTMSTTTTTPRPPPTTTSAATTTTSTTNTQKTTTTSTSTTTSTPILSTTRITTPASQSSRTVGRTSSIPGSQPSTTLTQPGVGTTEANTAASTSSAGINIGLVAGLSVGVVLVLIGIGAGVTLIVIHRKKQRSPDKNSAAGSVYYNVSPGTQPQPLHSTAPKIPQRKPQAGNTDTYEEALSPEAIQCDYYNIRGINDWNKVEGSVYEIPVRDRNEISGNTRNVYQQLDNTANGTIADTTAAVDYENLAISSDYITVD